MTSRCLTRQSNCIFSPRREMVRILPIPMPSSSLHLASLRPCFSSRRFSSSSSLPCSISSRPTLSSYKHSGRFTLFHLGTVIPQAQIFGVRASNFVKSEGYNIETGFSINNNNHPILLGQRQNHLHTSVSVSASNTPLSDDFPPISRDPHPLPEWSNLVQSLSQYGYLEPQIEEEDNGFALSVLDSNFTSENHDFLRAASACLSFARHRPHLLGSLPRKDVEIVVENISPFLFKSAHDSVTRMKSFLVNIQNNELVLDRAQTVDLMRFLLSYTYNVVVLSQTNPSQREPVESSVRNLLRELANETRVVQEPAFSASIPKKFPEIYGQTSMPLRQNIEMKRGDWICPKCTFMNFARNMKCLECDETRPKRQLTGGEWECPQCDFFNYGKNGVCIRCDCIRPTEASGTATTRFGLEYNNDTKTNTWNTRKTSLEQETISAQYQRTSPKGNYYQPIDGVVPGKSSSTSISQNLDKILGRTSEESKMGYVPFKPLPSDMFAKPQKSKMEEQVRSNDIAASEASELMSSRNGNSLPLSRKPVNQIESKEDKVQAEKSERWFKKVAELHDVTDLASAISDEDFPEIMPMRKGENRFVVSKKKDRSLTSPVQKRRMAMEQTNNSNIFVPFVPFPPDYFAKKDKVSETEASAGQDVNNASASATPEIQGLPENLAERKAGVLDSGTFMNSKQTEEYQQQSKEKCDTSYSGTFTESRVNISYGRSTGKSAESFDSLRPGGRESWTGGSFGDNRSTLSSPTGNSTRQSENAGSKRESWKGGFSGKSLEGSLVQEPDPLDMSEEAKAQRWFKRASQIKDISELSQIPDEDFPQIMPMRKGVNRFVVSKRKTPLERRLTSPQYRRNLPIVSSDPIKKDNSES